MSWKQKIFGNSRKSMNNQQNGRVILWLTWQKYETMYWLLTCISDYLAYDFYCSTCQPPSGKENKPFTLGNSSTTITSALGSTASTKVSFIYYLSTCIAQNFTKTGFCCQNERISFQHYILTKFLCCILNLFST